MTFLVLFVLAVVWAVYLVSWIRTRTSHRRVNSINSFSNHLSILERTAPATPSLPVAPRSVPLQGGDYFAPTRPSLSAQQKRRRDVLIATAGATAVTFMMSLLAGGGAWLLFLLCLGAFVGYVVLLVKAQQRKLERRDKVRELRSVPLSTIGLTDEIDEADETPVRRMYVVGGN